MMKQLEQQRAAFEVFNEHRGIATADPCSPEWSQQYQEFLHFYAATFETPELALEALGFEPNAEIDAWDQLCRECAGDASNGFSVQIDGDMLIHLYHVARQ